MNTFSRLLTTALLSCTPFAAFAQNPAPAPAVPTIDADPALWVVKDDDTTIYLFGTVHLLKPGFSWFDEAVKTAFDASDELVVEMIPPEPSAMMQKVMHYAADKSGKPLSAKLDDATRAKYTKTMKNLGLPVAAFESFEPWFTTVTIGMIPLDKAGYKQEFGAESILTAAAKTAGKKQGALESVDEQLGFFDSLPEDKQIAYLSNSLDDTPNAGKDMDKMVASWAGGDPETLGRMMNKAMAKTPELAKILLADRNARWAGWIQNRLTTPGTVFVAVGSGHLAGKDSVQDYLKSRKLQVTRIHY